MDDVPPWRAYVCIAFLMEVTDGALERERENQIWRMWHTSGDVHGLCQAFLEHREFDGDVRQGIIHLPVRLGTNGRVIFRVFVVLGYRSDAEDDLSQRRRWIPRATYTKARFPTS